MNIQKIRFWVCVLTISMMVFALPATAATTESERSAAVIFRTSLEPEKNLVVGQQMLFHVDLLVDTWFTKAPQVPEIKIPGALVLLPVGTSINFHEQIKGKSYFGQRHTYYIFPQKQGEYKIPSFDVSLIPAQSGKLAAEIVTLSITPQKFLARLPPELANLRIDHALATPQLTLENSLDRDLTELQIGDTIQRTVTIKGKDILGSALPSINPGDNDGLKPYHQSPKIENYFDRGRLFGKRIESFTYVVEQPGKYELPAIRIAWWNTNTQTLQTEVIDAIEITVSPSLEYLLKKYAPVLIVVAVVILGLGLLIWKYRRALENWIEAYRQSRRESESAYFNRFHQACLSNDPLQSFNCLMAWLERTDQSVANHTLERFTLQVNSPTVSQQVEDLEQYLFSQEQLSTDKVKNHWSGADFYKAIASMRKEWLMMQTFSQQKLQKDLPSGGGFANRSSLNPSQS